jgi:hypothetical protein
MIQAAIVFYTMMHGIRLPQLYSNAMMNGVKRAFTVGI